LPRRMIRKKRKSGRMFFEAEKVSSNMSLSDIMDIVFTTSNSYKEIARIILEWMKMKSDEENRGKIKWVTTSEMSNYINERLLKRRRSAAYHVIKNYLIPI